MIIKNHVRVGNCGGEHFLETLFLPGGRIQLLRFLILQVQMVKQE